MKSKGLIIVLLSLAAAMLITAHLRMPHNTRSWGMDISAAAGRADQRMEAPMPQGTVDVNRASAQELDELYGVGPALAQRIIEERETNGPFYYPEDLISVSGIGEKTLLKMWDQLKLP